MINSDSIREILMQDFQLQSLSATPSLQSHSHHHNHHIMIIQQ